MPGEGLERYEAWSADHIAMPPRSRLYPLQPIGFGTPYVENLWSFLGRLADAHNLSSRQLMAYEVAPLLGGCRQIVPRMRQSSIRGLNGVGQCTGRIVKVLEDLTLRSDLRFLTLQPYARVLPQTGLLRGTRAWCPACYQKWQDAGAPLYDPLLWTIEAVVACPRHQRSLSVQCPHRRCGGHQYYLLGHRARPGYCSQCGGWLGTKRGADRRFNTDTVTAAAPEEHVWAAREVGEIIAAAPSLVVLPDRKIVAASLAACINRVAYRSPYSFAKLLGVPCGQVSAWHTGGVLPRLAMLLSVCRVSGFTLEGFLGGKALSATWGKQVAVRKGPLPRWPRRNSVNVPHLKRVLKDALRDHGHPSLARVAYRLGHDLKTLRHYCPGMCREITRRHGAHARRLRLQEKRRFRGAVRKAVKAVRAADLYPSSRRVAIFLGKRGYRRNNEFYDEWKGIMRRLGSGATSSRSGRTQRLEPKS